MNTKKPITMRFPMIPIQVLRVSELLFSAKPNIRPVKLIPNATVVAIAKGMSFSARPNTSQKNASTIVPMIISPLRMKSINAFDFMAF